MACRGIRSLAFILVVALVGCATVKPQVVTVPVPVPVPCPVVQLPPRPELPAIRAGAPPEEQVGMLRQALAKALAYSRELEEKLKAYTQEPK